MQADLQYNDKINWIGIGTGVSKIIRKKREAVCQRQQNTYREVLL